MNISTTHKVISFIRFIIYTGAFFGCIFASFLLLDTVGFNQVVKESSFRIMTYNIHHGEGMDRVVDLEEIANIITQENPDILLLQEVDINLNRSGNVNIATYLSENTGLNHVEFGKNLEIENGEFGNATLTNFTIISSMNIHFEQIGPEQRGVLVTEISIDNQTILVLNSHFDHSEDDSERILYAEKVINNILPEYNADAVLFGGDFNDIPTSQMYYKMVEKFKDAWTISGHGEGNTIPADNPSKRIDYILFDGSLKPDSVWISNTEASDHLPVVADFSWVDE